jgi:hypothetical protein
VIDRRIDEVDRPDQVILVVKPLDEVAEPLGGVGRKMVNIVKCVLRKEFIDPFVIDDRPWHEMGPGGHVVDKSPAEIVQNHNLMALSD